MQVERLVATWEAVRATRSRLAKTEAVRSLLLEAHVDDVAIAVSFLSGVLPQGRIGMGWAAVGAVDVSARPASSISLDQVDATFSAIKETSGAGSKKAKHDLLAGLLSQATEPEQEFLKRLLLGGLRQGALEAVVSDAVAKASEIDPALVRRAAMVSGDLSEVADQALRHGASALEQFKLKLFTALQPMLAHTAENAAAAIDKIGMSAVEWKIDGARVQVHRKGEQVAVFTRNLRDITGNVPEVVRLVEALDVDSIILDGEAVALGPARRPVPFQETMSRFSAERDGSLDVAFFDCLHVNGNDLIDLPGRERWNQMSSVVPSSLLIKRIVTADGAEAQAFLDDAIAAGHEGVMVKAPDAVYEAGRRGASWLKVKPVHTLDLVVLAVEWGSGRRSGWLSNIHLGARDPDQPGEFVMLGKTFKGMTDDMLRWQTERFLELEVRRDGHIVHVRPEQVVEIAVDGIQASSRYPGGVALRFARVRSYRDDKAADEADTLDTVRSLG